MARVRHRILLLYPPLSLQNKFGSFDAFGSNSPPIGLVHLGSWLRSLGHDVAILDAAGTEKTQDEVVAFAARMKPDLIGITSETLAIDRALALARALKAALSPAPLVVLGGYHVSVLPEATLRAEPAIDVGVIGEGEHTMAELLAALDEGSTLEPVNGIVFRKDGQVLKTPPRKRIRDLGGLPRPDFGLLEGFAARNPYFPAAYRSLLPRPAVSVVASRGCPYDCTFCCREVDGRLYRPYPVDHVFDSLEDLVSRFGVRSFLFEDEVFYIDTGMVREFAEEKRRRKLVFDWVCSYRVDLITDERLRWLKQAGCRQIAFGIESGNDTILSNINKRFDVATAREALTRVKAHGIGTVGFFMLGAPGETVATLEDTRRFILEADLDYIVLFACQPSPGSVLYAEHERWGSFDPDTTRQNQMTPVFIPFGLDEATLEGYRTRIFDQFYFRPRRVIQELRFVTNPSYMASVGRFLLHRVVSRLPGLRP